MKLSTDQLARLARLLDDVVDADDDARRRWLESLPPEHQDLVPALLEALWPADAAAHTVLPAIGAGAGAGSGLAPGQRVGPWRLVRPLGSGGMAEVWLAQRTDGAFRREVALKTPSRPERQEELARRLAVERDILATLEHPRIARFYDAGTSDDGRPYLALEYVAGTSLLHWADAHALAIRARIELFLQVLDAVQYAHDKGVLHRDLKPANVLVTASGQVHLLDFGVARFMERPAEDDLTQVFGPALTPGYASPEHLQGHALDASSDVYSLGVMLHELLCGRRPAGDAARAERAAAIAPSACLDAQAAALRGGGLARVRRALAGDLDAIVRKALDPLPTGRYASVEALAQDLRRWLAGHVVDAVPPSPAYAARRFLARHRLGLAQAGAMALLVAGAGYALLAQRPPASPPPGAPAAAGPPATLVAPADKSIAVLPFADLSETRDQAHVAEGLSQEILVRLTRGENLRVIARTSAFAFKDTTEDARTIAARLGVNYLLQGSVRRSGGTLRVTAQLLRAADGTHLWSQTYERALADVFDVQDEIAGNVAHALEAVLVDRTLHARPRWPDLQAWDLVLQGEVYANGPFERDAERAEVLFKQAATLDPGYALPWARLALLHLRQADRSHASRDLRHALARQAIDTALRIEPDSMPARAARFHYLVRAEHRWADARAELDRMRALEPRDALLLPECEAIFAGVVGSLDEAIRIQRQIVDRDPLNAAAVGALAGWLLHADRLDESLALMQRERQLNPHALGLHGRVAAALALRGHGEQALAESTHERHDAQRLWSAALAYWSLDRRSESDAALAALEKDATTRPYDLARLYAVRGQRDRAFAWLESACIGRQGGCETLRIDRYLRALRDDPRHAALLARMKLEG